MSLSLRPFHSLQYNITPLWRNSRDPSKSGVEWIYFVYHPQTVSGNVLTWANMPQQHRLTGFYASREERES